MLRSKLVMLYRYLLLLEAVLSVASSGIVPRDAFDLIGNGPDASLAQGYQRLGRRHVPLSNSTLSKSPENASTPTKSANPLVVGSSATRTQPPALLDAPMSTRSSGPVTARPSSMHKTIHHTKETVAFSTGINLTLTPGPEGPCTLGFQCSFPEVQSSVDDLDLSDSPVNTKIIEPLSKIFEVQSSTDDLVHAPSPVSTKNTEVPPTHHQGLHVPLTTTTLVATHPTELDPSTTAVSSELGRVFPGFLSAEVHEVESVLLPLPLAALPSPASADASPTPDLGQHGPEPTPAMPAHSPDSLAERPPIPTLGDSPPEVAPPNAVVSVSNSKFTVNPASAIFIDSQTLRPGGPVITAAGTPVSLAPSLDYVVIGDQTQDLNPPPATPTPHAVFTMGSFTFAVDAALGAVVDSQTLRPGSPTITVSGTPVSLASDISHVMIDGSTQALAAPAVVTPPPVIAFGGSMYTGNPDGNIAIGVQTLTPGGAPITVSGTRLSLAPSVSYVVIGTSTQAIPPRTAATERSSITFGGSSYSEDAAGNIVVDGQTLAPGGPPITVSGTPFSLAPSAKYVVIGTSTQDIASPLAAATRPTITFGGSSYTEDAVGDIVVDGQTLTPGGAPVTISGT